MSGDSIRTVRSEVIDSTPRLSSAQLVVFLAVIALSLVVVVGSPVFGWFRVVRVSALVWAILIAGILLARPWRWDDAEWTRVALWVPSERLIALGAAAIGALLLWLIYSRFRAGGIDAVDFTIYFDRPLYQTSRGRIFFVESSDDPRFAYLTHLAVHAYWILLPFALLYWLHATPLWLLGLSVMAVTGGAVYVFRIVRRCGAGGALAAASALAFVLNGNTARALNYGFHAEILYTWLVPLALDAGLRRARIPYVGAVLASVLVKEDAIFPLLAMSVTLTLIDGKKMTGPDRLLYLVFPPVLAIANLAVFYQIVVPSLSPHGQVMYFYFWSSHGSTPLAAVLHMFVHPFQLLWAALTSGFFGVVMSRHFYLPLIGWRWIAGLIPVVLIYGASDNQQLRHFGIYYAAPYVVFLAVATTVGAQTLTQSVLRRSVAELTAAGLVLASAVSVGLGYSLRPWKEELRSVTHAVEGLGTEEKVFVQGGLYPHAGYDDRVQLLTAHDVQAYEGESAVILLSARGSSYPLDKAQWRCLISLPTVGPMPDRLLAVRVSPAARECVSTPSRQPQGFGTRANEPDRRSVGIFVAGVAAQEPYDLAPQTNGVDCGKRPDA